MVFGRRSFLQFVGAGVIAGKVDFRSPRLSTLTELVVNEERWTGAHVFAKVIRPRRWGLVELYLVRGRGEDPDDVFINGMLIGMLACDPKHPETAGMFDTASCGPLGPEYRIVARTRADEDRNLPIGGELQLDYRPYRYTVVDVNPEPGQTVGLNSLAITLAPGVRRRRIVVG
jgi:hypothetical protein